MPPYHSGVNIGISTTEISRKFSNSCKLNKTVKNQRGQK